MQSIISTAVFSIMFFGPTPFAFIAFLAMFFWGAAVDGWVEHKRMAIKLECRGFLICPDPYSGTFQYLKGHP